MIIKLKLLNITLILLAAVPPLYSADSKINSAAMKVINSAGDETSCSISSDGNMIVFARKPEGATNSDLYFTEYIAGKWSEAKTLDALNSESDDLTPYLSKDGKTIYFASNRAGSLKSGTASGPSFDIYYSEKKEGKWETPAQIFGAVNTMSDESSPYVTADGKIIYFARSSSGGTGKTTIIKVTKKDDFWEDVETAKIPGKENYTASSAAKSDFRSVFIFSGYKNGDKSRDIFFLKSRGGNRGKITEDPVLNTDGDEISFCEIDSNRLIISTNSGGISGSYDLFLKKMSKAATASMTESDITIKSEIKDYDNTEGINIQILYFKSSKPGAEPVKSETKTPDSTGDITLTVSSDIKRILVIPGNRDIKEFALEIFPGRSVVTPSIAIEKKPEREFRIRPVYFAFNSSQIQITDIPYMHDLIEYMRKNENTSLSIEGYADGRGSCRANSNISLARAEKIKEYLVRHGIKKSRIKTSGKGFIKENPKDTSQYSRRVEFILDE